jgi:HlyD family secretion protein
MRKIAALLMVASLMTAISTPGLAQESARPKGYQAVTKPSKDVLISFVRPGRVVEMLVDVGDEVKAGQLVARQDDAEEKAALAIDERKAKDETQVNAQITIMKQKQKEAERMRASGDSVGILELEAAELQAKVEEARVAMSKEQREQDNLKFQQSTIAVEKLKLLSPIDGVIAQRLLEKGETADGGNMKALRIVQLDPLRIEVAVRIAEARKLKEGNAASIAFSDKTRVGKIMRIFPVGDAASETMIVRVEVPNPDKLSSGEKVFVDFTPAGAGVAAKP